MNFLAEAFAKHIMCLFFSTKAFMCYVLNFFEKKGLHVLIQPSELHVKPLMCLILCLFFSTKAFICYVLNFFEKKSLHVLNWPCAYKKMSVMSHSRVTEYIPVEEICGKSISSYIINRLVKL